jgi:tRNA (cmo5U34)-methyltransferase
MTWKFDAEVANTFVDHARQHIPNYDLVIDKCVQLCKHSLAEDGQIIDVGCATGETLRRLYNAGFTNLTGVESSHAMLAHCDNDIADIIHSDRFPNIPFDVVICNWTLHFIKDKVTYLADVYKNLHTDGFLILSEKTSLDPVATELYHYWKHSQGVSWKDIRNKEDAVKDIMYIDNPSWYVDTLTSIGFKNIQIIDASWCFTTFIGTK